MGFEPEKITKEHILKAVELVDKDGIELRPSTKFDVIINNKPYPPKDIMRLAHEVMNGEYIWHPGGGEPTNKYLKALGFEIINKDKSDSMVMSSSLLEDFIDWFVKKGDVNYYKNQFASSKSNLKDALLEYAEFFKPFDIFNINKINCKTSIPLLRDQVYSNEKFLAYSLKKSTHMPRAILGDSNYLKFLREKFGNIDDLEEVFIPHESNVSGSLNRILYGPPGTGKTFNSVREAVKIALGQVNDLSYKEEFNRLRKDGQIEFVTFHQNYSYEDFVVGIKPDPGSDQLKFRPHQGIFYKIAKAARDNYFASIEKSGKKLSFEEVLNQVIKPVTEGKEVEVKMISGKSFWLTDITDSSIPFRKSTGGTAHSLSIDTLRDLVEGVRDYPGGLFSYYSPLVELIKKEQSRNAGPVEPLNRFVLIIDEINRANISRVFGELITLLEDDKRLGQQNELRVTLPNGEKDFSLPPNLYVVGTMNTADKSIALVDIALRRRFEFKGYYPDYSLDGVPDYLRTLNKFIYEKKKSADYLIGHAYFLKNEPKGIVLKNKVIPLLMEYFSGKTETVEEILQKSGIDGKYDLERYEWQVNL